MQAAIVIGTSKTAGTPVVLQYPSRAQHLYVVGASGAGKSNLLERIVALDLENGHGLAFLDPHGESVDRLVRTVPKTRWPDVIYWNPGDVYAPFGLNPFYCPDTSDVREVAARAETFVDALASFAEFADGFMNAPRMSVILQHLATTFVLNQGYCLTETVEFLANDGYREKFYPLLDTPRYRNVLSFWRNLDRRSDRQQMSIVESSITRLERLTANPIIAGIFGQPTPTLDFGRIMDLGEVLFVRLVAAEIGPENASFLGSFIVWEIFQAALRRGENRRPFYVTADEFQRFMTRAFPRVIEEGRKFGLALTLAHQNFSQLDPRSRAAVRDIANKVVFRVNPPDADELSREFRAIVPENPGRKQVLAAAPFTFLKTHAHDDAQVMRYHRDVQGAINSMLADALNALRRLASKVHSFNQWEHPSSQRREIGAIDQHILNHHMNEVEEGINHACYKYMSREEGPPFSSVFERYVSYAISHVLWELSMDPSDSERFSSQLIKATTRFAEALRDHPLYVLSPSGEQERARLYSDVFSERANELANLENYVARVRLIEDGALKEEMIRTERFNLRADPQAAWFIFSRAEDYVTAREVVEHNIERRLKMSSSATMNTYAPAQPTRDDTTPYLFEDDDEPGFEER